MEANSKKLQRLAILLHYCISLILCTFLILLSDKILQDIDGALYQPVQEDFENKSVLQKYTSKLEVYNEDQQQNQEIKSSLEKTLSAARENYNNEKQSFDNWIQAHKTLGLPEQDTSVSSRAKRLDEFYQVEKKWRAELASIQARYDSIEKLKWSVQKQIDKEKELAAQTYQKDHKWYELKVFLIRLAFIAPILALGIFFFLHYRKHKYKALFGGFTLFSIYAFFVGLVPYLPSYGGYVRYTVGILLSAGLGYYAIKQIREYMDRKQAELKSSSRERAGKVQRDTAEKALENHFCPSCGKDFIRKKWEFPLAKNQESEAYKLITEFCRHCGLQLFADCEQCGHKNFAHLPYCSSCGNTVQKNRSN
jgi:hypothetical protein